MTCLYGNCLPYLADCSMKDGQININKTQSAQLYVYMPAAMDIAIYSYFIYLYILYILSQVSLSSQYNLKTSFMLIVTTWLVDDKDTWRVHLIITVRRVNSMHEMCGVAISSKQFVCMTCPA